MNSGFSLVCFCGLTEGANCEPYLIVLDGQSKATIVTAENPSKAESMAADELQKYIQKISGAQLKIRTDKVNCQGNCILIGQTRFTSASGVVVTPTDPGREGFCLKTNGRYLAVAGSDELGTLYATYALLEMLGVRWFMPGDIGEVAYVNATCQAWLAQLGTHYMDYILWANNGSRARWAVGHVHGKEALSDHHPSPNYTMGHVEFENGVRSYFEFGKLSASHMPKEQFWVDDRLTVYGTHGYAWGDANGRWGAFTKSSRGEVIGGEGDTWGVQQKFI